MRIVVSGYMIRHPLAGNITTFFHYVLGLHRLGHEVVYVEQKGWPYSCYDVPSGEWRDFPAHGLAVVRALVSRHCPQVPVVYVDEETGVVDGMAWSDLKAALAGCDLLLDVSGMLWLEERSLARRRAIVDCDPLFTQVEGFGSRVLDDYDVHFSYGANVGGEGCRVPTLGFDWLPAVPPVVPDLWDVPPPRSGDPFTTVANWQAYGGVDHDGTWYGQKDVEFRKLIDLPSRVTPPVEIALSGADDDVRRELRAAGWRIRDGGDVTQDLGAYRDYIRGSAGEFSVAKEAYVATRSGWFSERTVCYLAAGRPAVVQDTGFASWLSGTSGVVAFSTPDEAQAAVERVSGDLLAHSDAAREICARHFDYRAALPRLLERAIARVAA